MFQSTNQTSYLYDIEYIKHSIFMVLYIIMERSDIGSPSALSWHDTKLFKRSRSAFVACFALLSDMFGANWHQHLQALRRLGWQTNALLNSWDAPCSFINRLWVIISLLSLKLVIVLRSVRGKQKALPVSWQRSRLCPPQTKKKEMFPQSLRKNQGQERLPAIRTCPRPSGAGSSSTRSLSDCAIDSL